MGTETKVAPVKSKRIRISVDVPIEVRRHLKGIANSRDMFFKDYLQDVFKREVQGNLTQSDQSN